MTNQFPHIKNYPTNRRRSLTARAARTGAKLPNANEIKEYLDKVYHVANVEFNIKTDSLKITDLENFTR